MHNFIRPVRFVLVCLLLAALPNVYLLAHRPVFQDPPRADNDLPSCQLFQISRIPSQDWRLEGLVASSDFGRILLRHTDARIERLQDILSRVRDYKDELFNDWNSPQLVKVELAEGAIHIVQAPKDLVMTSGARYQLPLLVKNNGSELTLLTIETPWKIYKFPIPGGSVRGFCLNIKSFEIGKIGKSKGSLVFQAKGLNAHCDLTMDIRPRGLLKVKLIGSDGEPAAARMYLFGSDQLAYMPIGAAQRIMPRTGEFFFYAKGAFELFLPEGEANVEAVGGLEFVAVRKSVSIQAGKTTNLELKLDHHFPLYKQQWYSCDSHIHVNYFENEVVTLDDISLQVAGEGLDIANLMVANSSDDHVHDIGFFEGKPHSSSRGHKILYWNEEMRNRIMYGHMSFFNLKELVYPIFTGFPGTEFWEDYPPNYFQAKKAKEQGGAVAYVHPAAGATFERVGLGGAQEFPVDIVLGQVDALDVLSNTLEPPAVELWYKTLNCGLRCAISAGTDCFTNMMAYFVPGTQRVYVHVPGEFTYQRWIDNYRKGVSFATNGPILNFSVNGELPGADLRLSPQGGRANVHVKAEVESLVPIEKLEIVVNGVVVISEAIENLRSHRIERDIPLERSGWVAARVWGPAHRLIPDDPQAFAHSSVVYCQLNDEPIGSPTDALFWADWIEQLMGRVRERGVFATPDRRESVIRLFSEAQAKYRKMAGQKP
ncbi:MAG: CehA/McbA family metallohydrolase [Acidobacteriota bacterium]